MIKRILTHSQASALLRRSHKTIRLFSTETSDFETKTKPIYNFETLYQMNHNFEKSINQSIFMVTALTLGSALLMSNMFMASGLIMGTIATRWYGRYNLIKKTLRNSIEEISYDKENQLVKLKIFNSDLEFTKPVDEIYFTGFYKPILFGSAVLDVNMVEGSFHVFYFQGKSFISDEKDFIELVKATEQPLYDIEEN